MQYFVKIHLSTGSLIEGYLESDSLNKLKSSYKSKSEDVCNICLVDGSRYDSNRTDVYISPNQIAAIESKFVR